jgi:hypothetical protein
MNTEGRISRAEANRRKAHKQDIAAAERLRRASSLPKPKLGPRIAR